MLGSAYMVDTRKWMRIQKQEFLVLAEIPAYEGRHAACARTLGLRVIRMIAVIAVTAVFFYTYITACADLHSQSHRLHSQDDRGASSVITEYGQF
jgi:hypothetical protein